MRNGRPLRFLAMTLGGWSGWRALALWQAAAPPGVSLPLPLIGRAAASVPVDPVRPWQLAVDRTPIAARRGAAIVPPPRATAARRSRRDRPGSIVDLAIEAPVEVGPVALAADQRLGAITPPLRPTPVAPGRSRVAGSAWLLARGGAGGTLLGGQLGASQAGVRLTYALGRDRRLALSARIATPLRGAGREAAVGIDWQPTRAPLHLIAEQRVSLDGGRGGPTLMAVGGIGPTPVAAGFRIEAYGEAGAIHRGGIEGFGDGAARLTRPVATLGPLRVDLGAGTWGAVQRGARRLDVGPTIGVVAPLGHGARYRAVRLTLDWRERVAGDARPGSGPALSLGTDF